jgi:heptosyltransferase-2
MHRRYPRARQIAVVAPGRGTEQLARRYREFAEVLVFSPKPTLRQRLRLAGILRRSHVEAGLVTYPGQRWSSALTLWLGGVRWRVGHRYRWLGGESSWGLNVAVPVKSVHDVLQNLSLLVACGVKIKGMPVLSFPLVPRDFKETSRWLEKHKLKPGRYIAVHPGSAPDQRAKRWPKEYWRGLLEKIWRNFGLPAVILGGRSEEEEQNYLVSRLSFARGAELPLGPAAGVAKQACLVLTNDSGMMHVSAAVGAPTVGLFGPTDERRTGPWGRHVHALRAPGTRPAYDVAAGSRLTGKKPHASMWRLKPDLVWRTVKAELEKLAVKSK